MPKRYTKVTPQRGVSRDKNTDINRPYNLENCQIRRNGFVRSVNLPTQNTKDTTETKPYIEWNGKMLDRSFYSTNENGTQVGATVQAQASLNSKLYRSVKSEDIGGNDNYRIVTVQYEYDEDVSTTDNLITEPAIAYSFSQDEFDFTTLGFVSGKNSTPSGNVLPDVYSPYIAIPYNKLDEPGPWFFFYAERSVEAVTFTSPAVTVNFVTPIDMTVLCNDETEYIEIYKMTDMNAWGFVHGGPRELPDVTDGDASLSLRQLVDERWFLFDTYRTARNNATGIKEISFNDNTIFVPQIIIDAVLEDNGSITDNRSRFEYGVTNTFSSTSELKNIIEAPDANRTLLNKRQNHHAIHEDDISTNPYQYHGFSANVMDTQNDVIMFGDIKYPTKRASTGMIMKNTDVLNVDIDVQLEYTDSRGNIYYGPLETIQNVTAVKFAWQGESALLVRVTGGNIYERLSPNVFNVYNTGFKLLASSGNIQPVPLSFSVVSDRDGVTFSEDMSIQVVDYIDEPNAVFISETDRGSSTTFDSFFVKGDETVRMITAARLAEEESIRDYDFYVFTDKSITLYKRSGEDRRTILPVHTVSRNLGVKQASFTVNVGTDPTIINLVTATRFGVAFVGTDDRVYRLVGRDLQPIDIEVPGLFPTSNPFRDIAYHADYDELWLLRDDSTVWVYSFIDNGWIGQYTLEHNAYNIYYREGQGQMHSWGRASLIDYTYKFDENEDNVAMDSVLITQPMDDGTSELLVRDMKIDYVRENYIDTDKTDWVILRHSVRLPSISQVEDLYDPATGKKLIQYKVPANRPFNPTLVGRGHQFRINNFQELRGFSFMFQEVNE